MSLFEMLVRRILVLGDYCCELVIFRLRMWFPGNDDPARASAITTHLSFAFDY